MLIKSSQECFISIIISQFDFVEIYISLTLYNLYLHIIMFVRRDVPRHRRSGHRTQQIAPLFGMLDSVFGMLDSVFGMLDSVFGMLDSVFGMLELEVGLNK